MLYVIVQFINMKSKQLISSNIDLFYTKASEETRLNKGMGIFEFERVKQLIQRHITEGRSLTIMDIGGGTGKYAEWLANNGHRVHLIEPVQKHLQIAQNRANKLKNKFRVHCGESRKLNFKANYADLVILHGPLYHLQNEHDRNQTIQEAKRVLKNNGIILAFAINYTASTLVGLLHGLIHKRAFFEMCAEELSSGIHNPPDDFPWLLAEAYYYNPEQLKTEFDNQGLKYLNTYAVEGLAWLDKDFFASMADDERKDTLMRLLSLTENDPQLLAFSPHMMIATQKQHFG
ncbi:ubiquinone/menaquinone biosynthesis C-methylase UbiE [Roseivirga pacifica]|uniref:Ubiquinone/menaquinone biosynthesis C-methylase UbiE n=2 Tax=Roseivirga pacifica TaxID=1267423 RepID=A0A1I0QS46_9BACT|nr:ubiquinone/menaquinone biosynthesis C-methylase UbiE [Roseivirga pacifica]SEW30410.1 Ubiquinone/menaquinone biosynthesis C-methylase UbiE [Roseivirga pacifica]